MLRSCEEPRTSRRGHGAQLTERDGTGEVVCQRRGRRSTREMTEMHEGDSSPRCVPQYRRREFPATCINNPSELGCF